jgi:hypothetical protein
MRKTVDIYLFTSKARNVVHLILMVFNFSRKVEERTFQAKSNSNTIFILSSHVESFSHVESHFYNFNSNTTLYFVFIFIKIIFFIFYFNFFSLSSFLFSSLCSRPTATHTTANPRQPIPRQTHTHGSTTTPRPKPKPPSTHTHAENPSHRQPIPTSRTQATVNPENGNPENPSHQKMATPKPKPTNKPNPTVNPITTRKSTKERGELAMENRGRERRKEREHRRT